MLYQQGGVLLEAVSQVPPNSQRVPKVDGLRVLARRSPARSASSASAATSARSASTAKATMSSSTSASTPGLPSPASRWSIRPRTPTTSKASIASARLLRGLGRGGTAQQDTSPVDVKHLAFYNVDYLLSRRDRTRGIFAHRELKGDTRGASF